jgi:hypothetical protein
MDVMPTGELVLALVLALVVAIVLVLVLAGGRVC